MSEEDARSERLEDATVRTPDERVCRAARLATGLGRAMTERPDVYVTLDLALRIGEVLLSSGAGAADVTATMLAVTRACGVRHVTADVTFVDLTLRHQPSSDQPAALQMRRVIRRPVDYADLIEIDRTVNDLVAGDITRDEARDQVARIVSTGHLRHRWAVTVGWGVMGTGIALTLGGSLIVCLLAFAAACAIDGTQLLLPQHRIPAFYQQAAGGFVATVIAVAASATELELNPSRVVTAGIVMLLAGVGIMGATQDALTGFPVTASARLIDALLNTAGIITGVGAGLTVGELLGVGLDQLQARCGRSGRGGRHRPRCGLGCGGLRVRVVRSCARPGGRGLGRRARSRGAPGRGGSAVGRTWGSAMAAVTIGAVCYLVAGRFRVPPLVVVVPAIVPLLPGLDIYRGLALLAEGKDGVLQLASAFATALALAAGVIWGSTLRAPSSGRRTVWSPDSPARTWWAPPDAG